MPCSRHLAAFLTGYSMHDFLKTRCVFQTYHRSLSITETILADPDTCKIKKQPVIFSAITSITNYILDSRYPKLFA